MKYEPHDYQQFAIDMSVAQDKANAILHCWYPGAQGGKTVLYYQKDIQLQDFIQHWLTEVISQLRI